MKRERMCPTADDLEALARAHFDAEYMHPFTTARFVAQGLCVAARGGAFRITHRGLLALGIESPNRMRAAVHLGRHGHRA